MKQLYFISKGNPRIMYKAVSWSSLQRYGATTAFICVLVGLWWFLHLRPLHKRIMLKELANQEAQAVQQEFEKLNQELHEIESKLKELEDEYTTKSPASFVVEWGACAQKSGLFLISARTYESPEREQPQGYPLSNYNSNETDQSHLVAAIYRKFVFIDFTVLGNFEALQNLMQSLYSLSYRASLENYVIDRHHDDSLSCTFVYKFYL